MEQAKKDALAQYGRTIRKEGWRAGEPLIECGVRRFGPDFKQWAHALGIMLRAIELVESGR